MTIALTLGVVLVALVCFVSEWFPADVTAIAVMVLLMTLGLVRPEEGISGLSNSATMTVLAMFILSAGIERTGAVQSLSYWLIAWGGRRASRQIVVMGAIVGPIQQHGSRSGVFAHRRRLVSQARHLALKATAAAVLSDSAGRHVDRHWHFYQCLGEWSSGRCGLRIGTPLNLLMALVTPPLIMAFYGL